MASVSSQSTPVQKSQQHDTQQHDTRRRYEQLVANIDGIVWEADPETFQFSFVSQTAERLLGYPLQEWYAPDFWIKHLHPDDRAWASDLCQQATLEQRNHALEYRMIASDGSVIWLSDKTSVVVEDGQTIQLCGVMVDISDQKRAEEERQAHLWFLQGMDQINRAIQRATEIEEMLENVFDVVMALFECDRAWLAYPCDPEADSWHVSMVRTHPEYPSALALNADISMDSHYANYMQIVQAADGPVQFGGDPAAPLVAKIPHQIQSVILMAIYPKNDKPYMFGLHQCSHQRQWNTQEERLFQEIGRRLGDALTNLRGYRELQTRERRLEKAQRMVHIGFWESDLVADTFIIAEESLKIFGLLPQKRLTVLTQWRETWQSLIHPDDHDRTIESLMTAIEGGPRYDVEYRVLHPSGEVRFVHSQGDVIRDGAGKPHRMFGVIQDITERKRVENELRASEARFRTFVDHAADAFFLHDENGSILDANSQACESLGYRSEELIGLTPLDIDADATPHGQQLLDEKLTHTDLVSFDTHHRRKDGTVFPVEVRIRAFIEGGRRFAISLSRDITERKKAEEDLATERALLRTLVDAIPDLIYVKDTESRFVLCNAAMVQDWNAAGGAQIIGRTDFDYHRTEEANHFHDEEQGIFNSGQPLINKEDTLTLPDGRKRWIITTKVPLYDATGAVQGLVGIGRDISELKRAELALKESNNLFRAVMEGTTDAIFIKDLQGRYLMINSAGADFLGQSVEGVLGKDDSELFEPEGARVVMEHDQTVIASGEAQIFEETAAAAGVLRTYLVTKSSYRNAQGDVIGIIGIARDISEIKQLEEQFRQAQKMEAVGQLAGGIAHDFNNLLTVINSYSQLALRTLDEDDVNHKRLAEIHKAGERAADLTRKLLAFSRKQMLQPQVVDINRLLSELLHMVRRLIGEDIELMLTPSATASQARIDPVQFEQAIINLAVNARDAMPQGGSLKIRTQNVTLKEEDVVNFPDVAPGAYIQISLRDDGHGMDAATTERIFEPFFTTKGPGAGTGLGLAMVYGFVKQSGAHIDVHSEPESGTTFYIYLPCQETTMQIPDTLPPALDHHPMGIETVLLVEDEDAVRNLASQVLQSSGYTVLTASNGDEAIALAKHYSDTIHLLVTDLVMPRMSGRQLAETLLQSRPEMSVLFISGYTDEAVLRHGVSKSTTALLQKPFIPGQLTEKVRNVLNTGAIRLKNEVKKL